MSTVSSFEIRPVIRKVTETPVRTGAAPMSVLRELRPEARFTQEEAAYPDPGDLVIVAVEELVPIIRDVRES